MNSIGNRMIILLTVSTFLVPFLSHIDSSEYPEIGIDMEALSSYYDKTGPILIDGTNVSYNNYSGRGTPDDPIIIDRVWINNSKVPGISILNSSFHLVISDTFISYGGWHGSSGIEVVNSTNVRIINSRIDACGNGILIRNSEFIRIFDTQTYNNDLNILVEGSGHIEIENSSIAGSLVDGIRIENSRSVVVRNCSFMLNCGRIANDGSLTIVSSNNIEMDHCEISGTGGHGVIIEGDEGSGLTDRIMIRNSSITGSGYGIFSSFTENLTISGMELKWNRKGIVISDCKHVDVYNSLIRWNDIGLQIASVDHLRVMLSKIRNDRYGLELNGIRFSIISGNLFLENGDMNIDVSDPSSEGNLFNSNQINPSKRSEIGVRDNGSTNIWEGNIWNFTGINNIDANGTVMIPGSAGSIDPDPTIIINEGNVEDEKEERAGLIPISYLGSILVTILFIGSHLFQRKRGS